MRIQAERNSRQNEKRDYRQKGMAGTMENENISRKEWQAGWKTRIHAERNVRQEEKQEYMQNGMVGRMEN
jgi:hypothetical protein